MTLTGRVRISRKIGQVGDAHFSRGVGLADTRTSKDFEKSISNSELQTIGDWWNKIAKKSGDLNAVNAQGLLWGTLGHATGVKTSVGAQKLELLANEIVNTANAFKMDPATVRDMVLRGEIPLINTNLAKNLKIDDYLKSK